MVAVDFSALSDVVLDPEAAARYLLSWHGVLGDPLVSVVMLPSARSFCAPISEVVVRLEGSGLEELVYPVEPGAVRQSVYVSAGTLREKPEPGRRGGKKFFEHAPGAWMDLDVREGGFRDWSEIMDLVVEMDRLGVGPQMIVGTGSGGAHCYWAVEGGVASADGERLGRRLRLWAEEKTGYAIDHCENADRVLRLPGSVRWPKPAGGGAWDSVPRECSLVRERREGSWCSVERITELTQDVWDVWSSRTREARTRRTRQGATAMETVWGAVGGSQRARARGEAISEIRAWVGEDATFGRGQSLNWRKMWALSMAEDEFDAVVSWSEILVPRGWRRYGDPDDEGRVQWTRPGGGEHSGRSLVTDWSGSPNVGSLLSMAPETGLRELHDSGAALTKHQVAATLYWNGHVGGLLRAWLCGDDWRRGAV